MVVLRQFRVLLSGGSLETHSLEKKCEFDVPLVKDFLWRNKYEYSLILDIHI